MRKYLQTNAVEFLQLHQRSVAMVLYRFHSVQPPGKRVLDAYQFRGVFTRRHDERRRGVGELGQSERLLITTTQPGESCLLLFYIPATSKVILGYTPQSHYPDTEPTSPCPILIMPSAWLRNRQV